MTRYKLLTSLALLVFLQAQPASHLPVLAQDALRGESVSQSVGLEELKAELQSKEKDLYQGLFNLKFQKQTGQLEKPTQIGALKKDLARVKTILREKIWQKK